uniref:Uncharacterized protein n=1 Tax=Esox lucius TaxID=8010 RepID=A0AAY5KI85_ESOLU
MEQPCDQQLVILSDQLFRSGYRCVSDRGVSEPSWHVSGWSRSLSCLHGLRVGRRKQEFHQELQEEEPHSVCHRSHGNQLLPAVAVWWSDGLHLWNYISLALRRCIETCVCNPISINASDRLRQNTLSRLSVILVHASLRLRNMKNRLENKIEGVGMKKSPMGIVLDLLDQQEEKINKIQDFLESKLNKE